MTVYAPERVWWRPMGGEERLYVTLAFIFAVGTFLLMPVWHIFGSQNAAMRSYRVEPAAYVEKVQAFVQQYRWVRRLTFRWWRHPPAAMFIYRAACGSGFPF